MLIPSGRELQEAIAVAKVHGVEETIKMCFRLKQEVSVVVGTRNLLWCILAFLQLVLIRTY